MIKLTRIDGREITINADEIESVDSSFDSTVTLKSGKKVIVREGSDEIILKVVSYRKECFSEILLKIPDVSETKD